MAQKRNDKPFFFYIDKSFDLDGCDEGNSQLINCYLQYELDKLTGFFSILSRLVYLLLNYLLIDLARDKVRFQNI